MRAWHGCKLEALHSILYQGQRWESRDEFWDGRCFDGAPGFYLNKDGTKNKNTKIIGVYLHIQHISLF